ncbi:MAG: hypothetical protein ISR58_21245 [Anaerolineales bacterium]|nr:hypothetical protein [Chloroflexota bacterium]MBL6983717.1 hypothetical protein [Anaerolineales bacterium]
MNEKDEKYNEKEMQKHDEKSAEEKSYEEKYRRDPLGALIWAVILIWAGVVMLAANFGLLDRIRIPFVGRSVDFPFYADAWPFFFMGAGMILLIEVLIRLSVPEYRRPVMGTFILAIVFFGVGLGNWNVIWPLVLIVIGVSILLRGSFRSQE